MKRFPSLRLISLAVALSGTAHGLDLQEAYDKALRNDPSWTAIRSQYLSEKEASTQARSGLLPTVTASANYAENTIDSESIGNKDYTYQSMALQARQPLFNADAWYGYSKAKASVSRSDADFRQKEQEFVLKVSEAYFNVLRAQENLAFAKTQEVAIARQLEQAKKRFEVGLIAITEVHEAQAAFDSSVADRLSAENAVSTALENLSSITGDSESTVAILKADAPVTLPVPSTADAWVKQARENNPQLHAARFSYEAAQAEKRQYRSGHLPTLDLVGTWQDVDTGGVLAAQEATTTSVGLQLNVPIYSGGRTQATLRQASYREEAARDQVSATERSVVQNTNNLYRSVATDAARVSARRQAIVSNESALAATQAGYEVGTRNIVDVLQAERNVYQARSQYANARYDYVLGGLRLRAAAGQLSAVDIRDLNQWLDKSGSISIDALTPAPAEKTAPKTEAPKTSKKN